MITYKKPMILIVKKTSWKLGFMLEARSLSLTEIHAYSPSPSANESITLEDQEEVFRESSDKELQIQHDFEHLDIPIVPVNPISVQVTKSGIELIFQVVAQTHSYMELLEELEN